MRLTFILFSFYFLLALFVSGCTMTGSITSLEGDGRSLAPSVGSFTISVSKVAITLTEGSSDTVNVVLNSPQATDTVVLLSLTSQTGVNRFNPVPTSVTIPAGQLSRTILLSTIDDSLVQSQETWIFAISSQQIGASVDPGQTVITLLDNDGGTTAGAGTTLAGPILLKEFNKFPATGLQQAALPNGRVVFGGTDAANGTELWVSDGTAIGTQLLKDIYPGLDSSNPSNFIVDSVGGIAYFTARTPSEGTELWRTDGTSAGTYLLLDSVPGVAEPFYIGMGGSYSGKTYFAIEYGFGDNHIFVSDGTSSGTRELAPSALGVIAGFGQFMPWKGKMYFSIASTPRASVELWSTDGTAAGTTLAATIATGGPTNGAVAFYVFQNVLYMDAANDWMTVNWELYKTDGTQAGTSLVKDINTQSFGGTTNGSSPVVVGEYNGKMILQAVDGTGAPGVWVSDGTTAGTVKLLPGTDLGTVLGTIGGKVVFAGGVTNDIEPWISDGTLAGTVRLKDIAVGASYSSLVYPYVGVSIPGKVLFVANDGTTGAELWVTDGTSAGTVLVKDINVGPNSSSIESFLVVGSKAIFAATSSSGRELWITDGTAGGTYQLSDINPGSGSSSPNNFLAIDSSHFFFTAYNPAAQFATTFYGDLTANSVTGLNNSLVTSYGSNTTEFMDIGANSVVFRAGNNGPGNILWVSDGTQGGTAPLIDIFPTVSCGDISLLGKVGGSIFFTGSSSNTSQSYELWATDGTVPGTGFFADLNPGAAYSTPGKLINFSSGISVFTATTAANGKEPWVTDGTVAGTHLLKEIVAGTGGIDYSSFHPTQQLFYMIGASKLWVTDGTLAGTVQISNFAGTTVSTALYYVAGPRMYILINNSTSPQIWVSDGTAGGTINVTPGGGSVFAYTQTYQTGMPDGKFYFTFNHPTLHYQIMVNDGTVGGNQALININWDVGSFKGYFAGKAYYTNNTGTYSTDGTVAGTSLMPSSFVIDVVNGVLMGGKLYYAGTTLTDGTELWVSDGTIAGTKMLKDINPGANSSSPAYLTVFNGKLYFSAYDDAHGTELWVSDGTAAGTQLLEDINPGIASSNPSALTVINGKLYILATKVLSGTEVWVMAP